MIKKFLKTNDWNKALELSMFLLIEFPMKDAHFSHCCNAEDCYLLCYLLLLSVIQFVSEITSYLAYVSFPARYFHRHQIKNWFYNFAALICFSYSQGTCSIKTGNGVSHENHINKYLCPSGACVSTLSAQIKGFCQICANDNDCSEHSSFSPELKQWNCSYSDFFFFFMWAAKHHVLRELSRQLSVMTAWQWWWQREEMVTKLPSCLFISSPSH